jgi:outer membrane receptor protein involved in Fe transport
MAAPGGVTPNIFAGFSAPTAAGEQAARPEAAAPTTAATAVTGAQAQVQAAGDIGQLLSRGAAGVETQQRTPVVSDPRIRGYRFGQVSTWADGGFFIPARLDLDTAVSKFDPGQLRDVIVLKGPYSVQYGPVFTVIDIASLDTPRYENGTEYHGRTQSGYASNGQRLNELQSIWGGGADWGFRVSYDLLVGNNYRAGGSPPGIPGRDYSVPSSYNSQPFNFAAGYNFSPDCKVEFKGLHLAQQNVEFPGTYWDLNFLKTDAESLRFTADHQEFFDQFRLDVWYNRTEANGDTHQGAKQAFLGYFLTNSFSLNGPVAFGQIPTPPTVSIVDHSSTNFSQMSRGYRMAWAWGEENKARLYLGTDLSYVNQQLAENIVFQGQDPTTGQPMAVPQFGGLAQGTQNLGIPGSHEVDPGIFLEAILPVNKWLSVKGGVRADWVHATSNPRMITGTIPIGFQPAPIGFPPGTQSVTSFDPIILSAQPFNDNLTANFQLWSAYVNADYKIDDHLTLQAAFGYAQRPPTLTELYAAGPFIDVLQQGLDRLYGDPHLAPEKLYQVDIGLRADYGWFRGSVSGYYAWINDYITFDKNSGGANSIAQVVFTNTDLATLAGGEMVAEMDLTDWLTPFGSLSYVQGWDLTHIDNRRSPNLASSRRTIDQEPLPSIPPLEGRVGVRVHEARRTPRWSVEGSARIVNEQNLVATSLGETPTPGFTVFDLRSFWQVNKKLLLTAGVENIGNKFYREHLDPLAGYPTDLLFRQGTNAYVSAQLQY